jgi:hypothetical protein
MNIYVALSQIIVILSLSSHHPGSLCDVHVPGPQFDMSPLELIKEYCVWFFICCHTSTYPRLTLTITPISVFPSLYHSSLAQRLLIASHISPFWQGRIELIMQDSMRRINSVIVPQLAVTTLLTSITIRENPWARHTPELLFKTTRD